MPFGAEFHYQIIREPDFDAKMFEIAKQYPRLNELECAIDWALSRKPHDFNAITNEYYFWVTQEFTNHEFPSLKIVYRIVQSERRVYLIDVEIA